MLTPQQKALAEAWFEHSDVDEERARGLLAGRAANYKGANDAGVWKSVRRALARPDVRAEVARLEALPPPAPPIVAEVVQPPKTLAPIVESPADPDGLVRTTADLLEGLGHQGAGPAMSILRDADMLGDVPPGFDDAIKYCQLEIELPLFGPPDEDNTRKVVGKVKIKSGTIAERSRCLQEAANMRGDLREKTARTTERNGEAAAVKAISRLLDKGKPRERGRPRKRRGGYGHAGNPSGSADVEARGKGGV